MSAREREQSYAETVREVYRKMYGDPPTGWRKLFLTSRNELRGWIIVLVIAVLVVAVIGGIIEGIIQAGRAQGRAICRNFGKSTGFKTKMVVLYWGDTGTCLAQAPNGQWVLNTKVQQFIGGKP